MIGVMFSELAYTRRGQGEPLVLIHGIGHRKEAWGPVMDQLADHYDVIAVDLAGFGESPGLPTGMPYSMDNACENLRLNFESWGVDRPHVAGNSLGGAIALELGHRDLARSVTGLSPAGFFTGRFDRFVALATLLLLKITSYLPEAIVGRLLGSAAGRKAIGISLFENADRFTAEEFLGDTRALRGGRAFFPVLKEGLHYSFTAPVDVPTTIAWGTKDKILLHRQSDRARRFLPRAHHVDLPNCGHVPMVDDPALIVRVIDVTTSEVRAEAA